MTIMHCARWAEHVLVCYYYHYYYIIDERISAGRGHLQYCCQ